MFGSNQEEKPNTFPYTLKENDIETFPLLKENGFEAGNTVEIPRGAAKSILRDEEFVKSLTKEVENTNVSDDKSEDQNQQSDENQNNQGVSVSEEEEKSELPKVDNVHVLEVLNGGRHILNADGSVKLYHCKCADGTTRHVEASLIPAEFVPTIGNGSEEGEE